MEDGMCCFSGQVKSVTATRIFARSTGAGRQLLAYQATVDADAELAMILPLPVPAGSPEDAVRFVSLERYPDLFAALEAGFPAPRSRGPMKSGAPPPAPTLAVVTVGSFQASFVPSVADFARLDPRFRLADTAWDALPSYRDWGFAVFALQPGAHTVHPMAFEFPRRDPVRLFFPTVHVHDGLVHARAAFDHTLYAQDRKGERADLGTWAESPLPAARFLDVARTAELVDGERHVHRLELRGDHENADVLV